MAMTESRKLRRIYFWIGLGADYIGMARAEFFLATIFVILLIALRIENILHYPFDSDEPAHLHVIWAWTRGFVQYRDIFSNNMPLFQLLFAPLFDLVGERATALFWMRFLLQPVVLLAAWCIYQIGAHLFSKRVGVWAVILTSGCSAYQFSACQFRADELWATFWLLCLLVLVSGRPSFRRVFVSGLLLGFCFAVSLKSILLLFVLVLSALVALGWSRFDSLGPSRRQLAGYAATFFAALLIVPSIIAGFFASRGIWAQFRYDVLDYNLLPHLDSTSHRARMILIFAGALMLAIFTTRQIFRRAADPLLGFQRALVFLICIFYLPLLYGAWSLVTRQDFLPWHSLVFVPLSALLLSTPRLLLPALAVVIELFFSLHAHSRSAKSARQETNLLHGVLALTDPKDYVFDCKGETVFRQRCTRLVFETITRRRIERGLIADDVPQRCVATGTCVATLMKDYLVPGDLRAFIDHTYLRVGHHLRVAGSPLSPISRQSDTLRFDIVIPASYEIIARKGTVAGELDGVRYEGARTLAPGWHTFVQTSPTRDLVAVWAQAVDRGFLPLENRFPSSSPHR